MHPAVDSSISQVPKSLFSPGTNSASPSPPKTHEHSLVLTKFGDSSEVQGMSSCRPDYRRSDRERVPLRPFGKFDTLDCPKLLGSLVPIWWFHVFFMENGHGLTGSLSTWETLVNGFNHDFDCPFHIWDNPSQLTNCIIFQDA